VKKTVSFSEEEDDTMYEEDTDSIFSKLKMIQDYHPVMPKESASEFKSSHINITDLHEKLLELEQRINANHAEIMAHLRSLK
jgi:hypothetical protein